MAKHENIGKKHKKDRNIGDIGNIGGVGGLYTNLSTVSLTICSNNLYSSPAGGSSTISGAERTVST